MAEHLRTQAGLWMGSASERAELCQPLVDHDIHNVCMISADAHMLAIDDGSHGGFGAGIADNRQFGVFEIDYGVAVAPRVTWVGCRAEKDTAVVSELIRHEVAARQTCAGF